MPNIFIIQPLATKTKSENFSAFHVYSSTNHFLFFSLFLSFPFTTQNTAYHLCNRSLLEGTSATTVRNLHQITAALVSLACRVEGHPRTIQEISVGSGLDPSVINNMQSTLARQLHVETGIIRPGKLYIT